MNREEFRPVIPEDSFVKAVVGMGMQDLDQVHRRQLKEAAMSGPDGSTQPFLVGTRCNLQATTDTLDGVGSLLKQLSGSLFGPTPETQTGDDRDEKAQTICHEDCINQLTSCLQVQAQDIERRLRTLISRLVGENE